MDIVDVSFDPGPGRPSAARRYTPACNLEVGDYNDEVARLTMLELDRIHRTYGHVVSSVATPTSVPWWVGRYVVGDPSPMQPRTITVAERNREKSPFREFRASRHNGSMILRDMEACKATLTLLPKVVGGTTTQTTTNGRVPFNGYLTRSPCIANYFRFASDDYSYPNTGNGLVMRRVTTKGATALPWPDHYAQYLRDDIARMLAGEDVDGALVTSQLAEANSSIMDALTELAELPDTIMMVVKACIAGIEMYRETRRKVAKLPADAVSDAASLWMAYRYGVQPIAYSVQDMLDVLDYESRKYQSLRAGVEHPVRPGEYFSYVPQPTCVHRCFIKQLIGADTDLSQRFRFNAVTTAWELIPLSFVVDWFLSVGDYLTSLFTPGHVSDRVAQYSWRMSSRFEASRDGFKSIVEVESYRAQKITPGEHRTLLQPFWLSWKRQVDAAALVWLLFRRNPKTAS